MKQKTQRRILLIGIFGVLLLSGSLTNSLNPRIVNHPQSSDIPIEFDGCITFGDRNFNLADYTVGDDPFDQLFSFYRNDQLDPNYPDPPYDPNITGYGISQQNSYPFIGNTEIIHDMDGHLNVLESHASENGYMEGIDIPDSPSSGIQTIEFWWAWENIYAFDWGYSPRIHVQSENGYYNLMMKTHDPYNRWFMATATVDLTNPVYHISPETVTNTINPNEFFRCRMSFNLDTNQITYTINGEITVTGIVYIPFEVGKILWISVGTGHSYLDKQWIDSLSWTWDSSYNEGDLVNPSSSDPDPDPNPFEIPGYNWITMLGIMGVSVTVLSIRVRKKL